MGILTWFARNSVAANMLMALIIVGGLFGMISTRKQTFPEFSTNKIEISVVYPGATPPDVETAICAPIEERVRGLDRVRRVTSVASEGMGIVTLELLSGTDMSRALNEAKAQVDLIDTFPEEAEKSIVRELRLRSKVLHMVISGPADELTLWRLGKQARDEIVALPGVTQVRLLGTRPREIAVEVSEQALNRHGLSFDRVTEALRRSSLDLPGGTIRSREGEILLRTVTQARRRHEFEELVLLPRSDGTRLRLGDVATVWDGFAETGATAHFDGQPAVLIEVHRIGDQSAIRISEEVQAYIRAARQRMPEGISLTLWDDETESLRSRIDTLLKNGRDGFLLILLVLGLFLKVRLAGWVTLGIPITLLGVFCVMPYLDLPVTLISLLAFLLVLGVVVDDAIVVGENIFRHRAMGKSGLDAAIDGLHEVARPVLFSVLTTIAAFAPLTLIPGQAGTYMGDIPYVAICALVFSLIEALLILPAHLAHGKSAAQTGVSGRWETLRKRWLGLFDRLFLGTYRVVLSWALTWRATTIALILAAFFVTFGLVTGGHVGFTFLPPAQTDVLTASLVLQPGTPAEMTARRLGQLEASARELESQLNEEGVASPFAHVLTWIGPSVYGADVANGITTPGIGASNLGEVRIRLAKDEAHALTPNDLNRRWRELTPPIPDMEELTFDSAFTSLGKPIDVRLSASDLETLRAAAWRLKEKLGLYPGVFDLADSLRSGKREALLVLTPEAEALGLTHSDLARQVRQAFLGQEIQHLQQDGDNVKVVVRYPLDERVSLGGLEAMHIRTPTGDAVSFATVGHLRMERSLASIDRTDGKRTVHVTADVERSQGNSNAIIADLESSVLPELGREFPGLSYGFAGEQEEVRRSMGGFVRSFTMAILIIYALLAIFFKSYLQPLIVMSAVPLGILGAIWGHYLTGYEVTLWSCYGILALTGVVVNDSLVLVDFINRARRAGAPLAVAIREAGEKRFRPIVLTSLTTFAGLLPLLLETSWQAQFLIPIAISLSFGVMISTALILVLVPLAYIILEDLKALFRDPIPDASSPTAQPE